MLEGEYLYEVQDARASVSGDLCQVVVITWAGAELPELRTQLNSGGKSGTAVVTASGSPLPCLVWSYTKPNNSVSEKSEMMPHALEYATLMRPGYGTLLPHNSVNLNLNSSSISIHFLYLNNDTKI